ncbi:MAG: hypothetical protein LBB47_05500 [Spirochaetaceae bacterium]|nr:hypothetical protein [Spirochaetaceae bacterium]
MKKLVILIVVADLAAGFIFIPQRLTGNNAAVPGPGTGGRPGGPGALGSRDQITVFAVRTAYTETRTLQAYMEVNGDIVNEEQVAV